jgi:N-acetylmuramoyl-L-alanine amidase
VKGRPSADLIIGGQRFHVEAPVSNMYDSGWDATKEYCIPTDNDQHPSGARTADGKQFPSAVNYTARYAQRPSLRGAKWGPDAVRAVVKQFVVHHDGCTSADMCFSVLQNERGLSCHFLIDNDGTIYQTIDLGYMAYHASDWNLYSIGVELCNRGDALTYPTVYDSGRFGPRRATKLCRINGNTIKSFEYTDAQYDSFSRLCRALLKLFPNLPAEYPQSSPGEQMWDTLPNASVERERYAGYIGHYHLTAQKWDPGHFDFKEFCTKLRGALCFPVFPKVDPKAGEDKPVVPEEGGELTQAANAMYALNEVKAEGGFFPVGPWGETRLWHGGVHLVGKADGNVYAPYPGRLVVARMGPDSAIGSFNFALLRHEMSLGNAKVKFFSLYMHLANEVGRAKPVAWVKEAGEALSRKRGQVALLDLPIEAGALIGHIGKVGPGDLSKAQIHVEFFAEQLLELKNAPWVLVDGSLTGRFCNNAEINDKIDKNKDGKLSTAELKDFFAQGGGEFHHLVNLHVSEWAPEPSWVEALVSMPDYAGQKPDEIAALVAEQITPGLWWDAAAAAHCKLPKDGVVYHYHPVAFMKWFKNELIEATIAAARSSKKLDEKDVKVVPKSITDDYHDTSGASMRSVANVDDDPCNKSLTLEQMVQGFDAPECAP